MTRLPILRRRRVTVAPPIRAPYVVLTYQHLTTADRPTVTVYAMHEVSGECVGWVQLAQPTSPAVTELTMTAHTAEGFAVFAAVPDFFAALGEHRPATVAELVAVLRRLDATETPEGCWL